MRLYSYPFGGKSTFEDRDQYWTFTSMRQYLHYLLLIKVVTNSFSNREQWRISPEGLILSFRFVSCIFPVRSASTARCVALSIVMRYFQVTVTMLSAQRSVVPSAPPLICPWMENLPVVGISEHPISCPAIPWLLCLRKVIVQLQWTTHSCIADTL